MANVIKLKSGDSGDSPASNALVRGEVAIRHVAANHTASSSSKLYFGEAQGSGSVTLRQFGFGITDGSTQSGVAIGENLTFTGGNAISTSVSGNAVTINHDDTSSQSSVNNSGSTFIQDITIDTYGHVTGITSADAGSGSVSGNTFATDLKIGRDADNLIDFTTDNDLIFRSNGQDAYALEVDSSGHTNFTNINSDKDIIFKGNDGGVAKTALTLDMSASGKAIFNDTIEVGDNVNLKSDGAVLGFGADNDVTLEHQHNTGIRLNSDNELQFGDSETYIHQSADQFLDIVSDRYVRVNVDNSDNSGAFVVMDSTESAPTQKIYLFPDDNPTIRLDANGGTFGQLTTAGSHLYITSADDIYLGGDGTNGITTVDDIHINVGDGHVLNFDENGTTRATFNLDSTPELDVTGDFTIDCSADIILDADGSQVFFKDGGTERFRFNLDSTPEMDVTGTFTIDCTDDIILDADGSDITFKDGGSTRINFDLDSTPTMDVTGAFDIKSSTSITLDATSDITLSADGDQINMDDGTTTRFVFNVDSTPELDVTGNFKIDCSGDITLDCASSSDIIISEAGGTYTPSADNHVATKKYVDDNAGGGGSPGGSDGHVQFNNSGSFGGEADFTWDSSNGLLKLTHGAASSQIELESTVTTSTSGPRMTFFRNSSSPADNDTLGRLIFKGNTSTSNAVYADIIGKIIESTEGQSDGGLIFRATVNGSDNQDIMRVESGTSSVKQVVPGGNNTILLGNSSTAWKQSYVREYYGYDGSSFNGGVTSANTSSAAAFTTSTGTDITTGAGATLTFASAGGIVTLADIQAAPSDSRYKENVVDLDKGLTFLESLPSAKTFDFKDSVKEIGVKEPKKNELGFLAQDIEKILPDVIVTVKEDNSEFGEFKTINYPEFDKTLIYSLVNAVKELSARVKELEAK